MSRSLTWTPVASISAIESFTLDGLFALGLAPRQVNDIQVRAAIQENVVRDFLQFTVYGFDQLLAVNSRAQQRLQYGQEGLGFFKRKGAFGHNEVCSYSNSFRGVVVGR